MYLKRILRRHLIAFRSILSQKILFERKKRKKKRILMSETTSVNISASCWGAEDLDDVFYVGKEVRKSAVWL